MKILDKIDNPKDLKDLNLKEKDKLALELREYILDVVSKNGGHLASNLGIVELTIAMLSVYNLPKDKIVYDVGHQSYVHKILTGRKEEFKTLRKYKGMPGFPKISESKYDSFGTGHSSTSISAALGMAQARDLKGEDNEVIAVIGDGALTGGMAFEALNDAGSSKTNITVILNDNEMSISKNVGGMSLRLGKLRSKRFYKKSNEIVKNSLNKVPIVGTGMVKATKKVKKGIKNLLLPNMLFEDLGFTYLGPVDGHNIEDLEGMLRIGKKIDGPKLIHVITTKGKGYEFSEKYPDKFHGTSAFNIKTGKGLKKKSDDYSKIFGEELVKLASKNKKIVAVCAAMKTGTGLVPFSEKYPDRFFDVGIAEQHALTFAAGLAKEGFIPFVPIYSSFYQRAYDQVIHDIAIQKLPVIMCVDRAGNVGNDGETHQGLFDLSFFNLVPNLTIMNPKDFKELESMMKFATLANKPIVIRYPRGGEGSYKFRRPSKIEMGKAETICEGSDVTIVAIGKMVDRVMAVKEELLKDNISCEVINARFLKPFDDKTVIDSIKKTNFVVTIEDSILTGGLASKVKELIVDNSLNTKLITCGYPDKFIQHGSVDELEKEYELDVNSIVNKIKSKC